MDGLEFQFDFNSPVARKSRFALQLSQSVRFVIFLAGTALFVGGLALWLSVSPILGSILLALSSVCLIVLLWYHYDISSIAPSISELHNGVIHIESALPFEVVGRLRETNSLFGLWLAHKDTFFMHMLQMRFGLVPEVFAQLNKDENKEAVAVILRRAYGLSRQYNLTQLSPVAILIALLESLPDSQTILAQLKIDDEDLLEGIRWIHHQHSVMKGIGKREKAGGLARDWTSGFTPTLNTMSTNITDQVERGRLSHISVGTHQQTIDQMLQDLLQPRSNVLLSGEVGSGKTISVYGLAKRIITDPTLPPTIRFFKVYQVSASAVIASSDKQDRVESTLYSIVAEAAKAKDIILFFDNAINLFTTAEGAVDLRRAMLDIIKNSPTPIILEMTPSEWQQVAAQNQEMAGLVNILVVPESDEAATLDVLEDHSILLESQHRVIVTYKALKECISLADRYVQDLAFPGKAINLLESAMGHADGVLITEASMQRTIEAIYGVKAQIADATEGKELLNLEEQIHKRMVNQTRAVKVVSDALRRARSGVSNPDKPIGTFLFLGPTGVGKTELSKALSEVYFGDENKIVRVDLNEYTQSSDLQRLLDPSSSTGLLAEVGRNRFCVVLFDEIEKAHPDVVNAFLQLLDEGEMRDVNNRPVSFRDAIVIATTNAGADRIRAYIDQGREVEQFEQEFINELIDSGLFRPEFLNRFDETVVFRPLKDEELLQVTDLIIAQVNQTLTKQKITVALSMEAKTWLVSHGNDPRLGARPLRRVVQRTVENIVAKKMLAGEVAPGSLITLGVPDLEAEQNS